jgi:hypothetical protein
MRGDHNEKLLYEKMCCGTASFEAAPAPEQENRVAPIHSLLYIRYLRLIRKVIVSFWRKAEKQGKFIVFTEVFIFAYVSAKQFCENFHFRESYRKNFIRKI